MPLAKGIQAPSKNLFKDKNTADKHFRDICAIPFLLVLKILGHNLKKIKRGGL